MKYLLIILIITFSLGLTNCDNGSDTTAITTSGAVVLASGSKAVGADSTETVATVTVGQPGEIMGTVEWSTGPSELSIGLTQSAARSLVNDSSGSPLIGTLTVTQNMLDTNGTQFTVFVVNEHLTEDAVVTYTVTFTPSD